MPPAPRVAQRRTAQSSGSLVALYEHSIFTQATVWSMDPFDQGDVAFGTSGHRGSSFGRSFNGPLYLGIDTHTLR